MRSLLKSSSRYVIALSAVSVTAGAYRLCNSSSGRSFCDKVPIEARAKASVNLGVLPGEVDAYRGVNVDLSARGSASELFASSTDVHSFHSCLQNSLVEWKNQKYRGVWLKIPLEKSHLVPVAVDCGFTFHHAEPDYVMLTHWVSDKSKSQLPANASHQVGVGCVVIHPEDVHRLDISNSSSNNNNNGNNNGNGNGNGKSSNSTTGSRGLSSVSVGEAGAVSSADKGKGSIRLLAVQEKRGPLRGKNVWKLPTGLVDAGEDVADAAQREVLEETGIRAVFQGVACIRHLHGVLHGKSDMFFVCVLAAEPESSEIRIRESEIGAAKWLTVDAYLEENRGRRSGMLNAMNEVIVNMLCGGMEGASMSRFVPLSAVSVPVGPIGAKAKTCTIFHAKA